MHLVGQALLQNVCHLVRVGAEGRVALYSYKLTAGAVVDDDKAEGVVFVHHVLQVDDGVSEAVVLKRHQHHAAIITKHLAAVYVTFFVHVLKYGQRELPACRKLPAEQHIGVGRLCRAAFVGVKQLRCVLNRQILERIEFKYCHGFIYFR